MHLTELSADRRAELLARYPHEPNSVLRAEFGLTQAQLSWATRHGKVKKTKATLSQINSQKRNADSIGKRIYNAVGSAGKAGLALQGIVTAIDGSTRARIQATLYNLTTRSSLHRVADRGRGRWFTRKEWANEYAAWLLVESAARARAASVPGVHINHGTAPAHLPGEPNVPTGMRATVCPSFPSPASRPVSTEPGLFTNLKPGRYIDDQPKAWVGVITSKDQREDRDTTHREAA